MVALLAGCTPESGPIEPGASRSESPSSGPPSSSPPPSRRPASPTVTPSPTPKPAPADVSATRILADIERLAGDIGPREATSKAFYQAAELVEDRFGDLGYRTRRTEVEVPAGNSWGTRVRAGTSVNVIADSPGLDPERDHVVIGAHLDTVPVAPGAEDNASGVAVMLELARLASIERPEVPVRFIAFGAEEPRGDGDAWHHFGSQQLVADLSAAERRAVRAMVSLDRVGVRADYVPVCRGGSARSRAPRSTPGRGAGGQDHDSCLRQPVQRSLVVREGGDPGGSAGQHRLRRLPLPRGCALGGESGAARSGRPAAVVVAGPAGELIMVGRTGRGCARRYRPGSSRRGPYSPAAV